MREKVIQISSLMGALQDMEPYVRNPNFLRTGRKFTNFNMLPRELLANWLICAVARCEGQDWTFSEDPKGGDGNLINKKTLFGIPTEHIFLPPPKEGSTLSVEDQIINAVEKKTKKGGAAYANGKTLVVFSEAVGPFQPNVVARKVTNPNLFEDIYVVGLERNTEEKYEYWVTRLDPMWSPIWKIFIYNFKSWEVIRSQ